MKLLLLINETEDEKVHTTMQAISEKQKQAFQKIKEKFKKKSILIYFNYKKSVIIDADASEHAMRAHLQQLNDQK